MAIWLVARSPLPARQSLTTYQCSAAVKSNSTEEPRSHDTEGALALSAVLCRTNIERLLKSHDLLRLLKLRAG